MNRTRTRALLAAAALGVATIALPIAASASSYQTCDDVPGITKIDQASGSHNGAWGTISWSGNDLDYDLNEGWSLEVCLKAGSNVQVTGPHTGAGTVTTPAKNEISHIGHNLVFEEPSDDDGDTDDGIDDDGIDDDGIDDDGSSDDGLDDDGIDDDGIDDDGIDDDGSSDDGLDDDGTEDDGTEDDGTEDDGTEDDGTEDDGTEDDGTEDDGTEDDGVSADDGVSDGTDEDGTDEDGTDEDGTDDDGVDVLPGGEVAPVDGDDDGDATDGDATDGDAAGDDGTETAEVPVEVLPATLDSRLPNTGSDVPALVAAAALALGLGGSALVRTRRRTTSA